MMAARIILGLGYSDPVSHRFPELDISPINQLIKKRCMIMIHKIKHSMAPIQMQYLLEWRPEEADMIRIRHRCPLIVPFARTKFRQHAFRIFAPRLINSLSVSCNISFNIPISAFKAKVAKVSVDSILVSSFELVRTFVHCKLQSQRDIIRN